MTYQKALAVLTDWFHEYHDDKGVVVRERRITAEYNEAVDVVSKALCKLIEYENKIAKGEYIAPFKFVRPVATYNNYNTAKGDGLPRELHYGVFFLDKDNFPRAFEAIHEEDRDRFFEELKENK